MGGNIWPELTRRYSQSEYTGLERRLSGAINSIFKRKVYHSIPYYRLKPDFGDIDFVLDIHDIPDWKEPLINGLNLEHFKKNGSVFSFVYENIQADAITISSPYLVQPAVDYFSYNDISNLIGRMAHRLGFKLGHTGTSIVVRDPENPVRILDEIVISHDYSVALDLLGLDIETHWAGFNTMTDMFEYVASSPYFNTDIYLFDNRNHRSRIRDQKRQIYHAFLEWIKINNIQSNYDYSTVRDHGGHGIREPFFTMICDRISELEPDRDLRAEVDKVLSDAAITKQFKNEYFNGDLVSNKTGLVGKELGQYMRRIRDHLGFPLTPIEQKYFMKLYQPEEGFEKLVGLEKPGQ